MRGLRQVLQRFLGRRRGVLDVRSLRDTLYIRRRKLRFRRDIRACEKVLFRALGSVPGLGLTRLHCLGWRNILRGRAIRARSWRGLILAARSGNRPCFGIRAAITRGWLRTRNARLVSQIRASSSDPFARRPGGLNS